MNHLLTCLLAFIVGATPAVVFAQTTDTIPAQRIPYEKVYLHTDRELYSPGDTVWFKAYLASGLTHRLQQGYKNIYVELISDSGKVVANRLLLSINGESHGDFALPRDLTDGQYTVRARTKYLENFDEESFFHKRILVSKAKSSVELNLSQPLLPKVADAMFFPEGGFLVQNATNHVAFKAFSSDGKGVEATGKIMDESGETVTTFKTSYLGMGSFVLMPEEGKTYYALLDSLPGFKYTFDKVAESGVALHYKATDEGGLISFSRNIKTTGTLTYTLSATHKGVKLFNREITIESFSQALKLGDGLFPPGITKLTLLDSTNSIVAERLIFEPNTGAAVKINLEKEEFVTRENVNLSIETLLPPGDSLLSTLSVSVANLGYFGSAGNSQTIESYLLLDSELKGAIEEPTSYFYDSENITSAEKLDLLMRVQGWRSYYWDHILPKIPKNMEGWDDAGLSVSGYVKRMFRDRPVVGGQVTLGPYSKFFLFEKTSTDSLGRFLFDRLYLEDSANVFLNAKTEQGRSNNEIVPDSIAPRDTFVSPGRFKNLAPWYDVPLKYYRDSYYRYIAEKEFAPEKGSILIKEVEVFARKKEADREDFMPFPYLVDNSFKITEDDYHNLTVLDFIMTNPRLGLKYEESYSFGKGDTVIVYGNSGAIPVYVDGTCSKIMNPELNNLFTRDIYIIETSFYPPALMIYTKKFNNREKKEVTLWGKRVVKVYGFQKPNEYYSPKYTLENITSKQPDYRPTLFWSPSVVLNDGKATVSFFTCDNLADYVVFVEGISKNGRILSGVKQFGVTEFNPAKE